MALLRGRQDHRGAPALSLEADRAWLRALDRAYDEMDRGEEPQEEEQPDE
jgi:hypothetical protein